jgi:hypothetical protein
MISDRLEMLVNKCKALINVTFYVLLLNLG